MRLYGEENMKMMAQKYPWKSFEEAKLKKKKMDVILNTAFIVEPQKTKCFELGKCLSAAKKIFEKTLTSSKISKTKILKTIPEESIILRSKGAMAKDNNWKRCDDSPESLWLTIYLPSLPYLSSSSMVPSERRPEFLQLSLTCHPDSGAPIVPEFSERQQKLYDFACRCSQFCLLYQKLEYNTACLFDPKKLEISQVVQKPMNEKELFVRWFVLKGYGNEETAGFKAPKPRFPILDLEVKGDHSQKYTRGSIEARGQILLIQPQKKPQLVKQPADEKELYVQYSIETEKCYGTTRERAESRWEERKNVKNGLLYVTWKMHAVKLRLEHENQIRKKWIVVKS
ncbi:unnamed protein product [Caenorhabditis nigoni]